MTSNTNYSIFWDERFWFPKAYNPGWKDLKNEPGSSVYYPQIEDLNWTILVGILLIFVRYFLETFLVVPIATRLGVPDKKIQNVTPNPKLESVYSKNKTPHHTLVKTLAKQTDLTDRQIEIWFRKRKKMDRALPIQKFRECSWLFTFYTVFSIYGLVILWDKPYFWKSLKCWEGWPKQHVSRDIYWYYIMELGFYWSLLFTLCTDVKRKDFKQMTLHHFATIILIYFSWVLNFVRVGSLVLVIHDAADAWLALAKMCLYSKNKTGTDIFFGIFLLVWTVTRMIIYPYVVLYSTTIEPYTSGVMSETFGAHLFFNFFLYLLFVLHLIWTYLIYSVAIRKLLKGDVEDVRSDSDDSGADTDGEDEVDDLKKGSTITNGHTILVKNDCMNNR